MESFLPLRDAMSPHRSLVFCLAAAIAVACGGDEDAWFSNTDAAPEAAGGQAGSSASGGSGSGGDAGSSGAGSSGGDSGTTGAPNDGSTADATDPADAGTTDATAGDSAGGTTNDGGSGASGGSGGGWPDAGLDGCARPTVYYADKDKDGHGSAGTSIVACSPPSTGTWILTASDCNDSDSRVHPGQAAFFAVGYRAASGASSFDYDCSGKEDEDPAQTKAPMNCGLLSLALCAGSGYAETPRTGEGLSAYCGSSEVRTCRGLLLCENVSEVVDQPFRCR